MRPPSSLSVVVALLWSLPVLAQEVATKPVAEPVEPATEERLGRELGGHLFLPSHLIDDPFSYTAFGTAIGLGNGSALGPTVSPTPPILGPPDKWYDYQGLGIAVVMNVRILEYLSARAALGTTAYLGTGNGAAFTVGTSARITGDLGVKGSLPVGEHFRFAATLDASYGPVYAILIGQGLQQIIADCQNPAIGCQVDPAEFLQQSDTLTWIGGLSGAWAPLPYLGVVLNAQFIAPTRTQSGAASVSQNGYTLAGMVDFDARPLVPWLPVGVNGMFSITSPIGSNGVTTTKDFGFGIYYTGEPHLALGVEIDWRSGKLENEQISNSTLTWLNFRYYWN
jgi:hypothetical protein